MLYYFLKYLMKITQKVFFRHITIQNKENIPGKGPLLIVANHPATFTDPIVIATMVNIRIHFLAKGALFKSGFAKWMLPKLNIIPVYRKVDDPALMNKNDETFEKCYQHLEKKGAVLLFPEGISIEGRKLQPMKTGAARIVLGAEARNGFNLQTKIMVVGLNFDNPHKFNRDLFINIAPPISVGDYKDKYAADPFRTAKELTEAIRAALEKVVIDISDRKTEDLMKRIELVYKYKLGKDLGISTDDAHAEFNLTKNMAATVDHFMQTDPERAMKMDKRLQQYFENLRMIGVRDADVGKMLKGGSLIGSGLTALFIIVAGFPFYLYGVINNYLPFKIPGLLADRATSRIEFRGPISMAVGIATFAIFYSVQISLVHRYTGDALITLLYAISLPVTGFFAWWYFTKLGNIRARWRLLRHFNRRAVFVSGLMAEREQIIAELDRGRAEYDAVRTSPPQGA